MAYELDPNHIIDEDYTPQRGERIDEICAQRLKSPDFGCPCSNWKRRAIGFLLIIIGLIILYCITQKYLG